MIILSQPPVCFSNAKLSCKGIFNSLLKPLFLITVTLLTFSFESEATIIINPQGGGGFEIGSTFLDNGWTAVNNPSPTANNWAVGTGTGSGSNFAYISQDGGNTHSYNTSAASTVHFYQSVTIPSGETNISLSFLLKSVGEQTVACVCRYRHTCTWHP